MVTSNTGMHTDEQCVPDFPRKARSKPQKVTVIRRKGERRRYVSQHFASPKISFKKSKSVESVNRGSNGKCEEQEIKYNSEGLKDDLATSLASLEDTKTGYQSDPKTLTGIDCSDSELTDVPDDIGPNPFFSDEDAPPPSVIRYRITQKSTPSEASAPGLTTGKKKTIRKRSSAASPYFATVRHAHRPQFLATLPFPPLSHERFGLMQENLAHDPYRLLLATIFLNKTPGIRAMPIFYKLMERYPSPQALAEAEVADITSIIRELGFQNQRAVKCVKLAQMWVDAPPRRGKRYRKLHYPQKGDGRDLKEDEIVDDDDSRVAWEISHLPGLGPYSHDSWRMFCRDTLRGEATDWLGTDTRRDHFEPEWKRVLPTDKELRAWMTWMWLKEGWMWNKETGEKTKADEELMRLAKGGGVVLEQRDSNHLVVQNLENARDEHLNVEKPAGNFMPDE